MKLTVNHGFSLVIIAFFGLSLSAYAGVTETPAHNTISPDKRTEENQVVLKVPSKYMPLLAKAEKGNAQAQHDIATLFNEGKDVEKDPKEAFQWF